MHALFHHLGLLLDRYTGIGFVVLMCIFLVAGSLHDRYIRRRYPVPPPSRGRKGDLL